MSNDGGVTGDYWGGGFAICRSRCTEFGCSLRRTTRLQVAKYAHALQETRVNKLIAIPSHLYFLYKENLPQLGDEYRTKRSAMMKLGPARTLINKPKMTSIVQVA